MQVQQGLERLSLIDPMDGSDGNNHGDNMGPGRIPTNDHRLAFLHEMQVNNFDLIRFASYRTACKLRFIQKKTNLNVVDIWNVIEAFREHALNTLEPNCELSIARLETLLCSLFHNLNKRLPQSQQVMVDQSSALLLNWLLSAYATVDNVGKIRVFSVKIALATISAGKLMDKLRYIFSLISDNNGLLVPWKFNEFLQDILSLPASVYESPSFKYTENLGSTIFPNNAKITVNDFMDCMMSDPGPAPLVWLPLFHRLASVENVVHPTTCDACQRENFTGFRYRCQKCPHYTLCQECFWRGRVSASHTNEHQVKEYSTYKSPSKQLGHSLRKSFRCVPEKPKNALPKFPDQPEKTLNLSHIVPPSPLPSHNGFSENNAFPMMYDVGSMDSRSTVRSLDSSRIDDEHRLIARYAARLAQENKIGRAPSEASLSLDTSRAQRELITQLEAKNREIMREIARLRHQQEIETGMSSGADNPALVSELRALRQRKDELETHLSALQDSRRQLMVQLEGLMKMLKNHQSSPRSTPNSSPRSTKSPPLLPGVSSNQNMMSNQQGGLNNLTGSGGRSLRNDLLVAADSVTNAMSTLVRELNSEDPNDKSGIMKPLDFEENNDYNDVADTWQELQRRYEQEANFMLDSQTRNENLSDKMNNKEMQKS
ncbi:dystrobrevin beta-like isoform X3 [Chrysoperla carnea]|uniref:dystrobrevin beta-like isoform X3 n=1 Tax=Chrysoperla carnea TaxID=189513 RepID=UPI001D069F08|nr:dystrobrevin beta-like isoform X3 [Chrysoperla carnea]